MIRAAAAPASSASGAHWRQRVFAMGAGAFIGLCILKFGSPCILDAMVPPPASAEEWRIAIWPPSYGYFPLAVLCIGALFVVRLSPNPGFNLITPPLVWFGWQCLSAVQTIAFDLTALTLVHFAGCLCCYFVGLFALSRVRDWRWFAAPILIAFLWMLRTAVQQRFGGLADTRAFINAYYSANSLPEELVKRMNTGRVFATLFYPNAFAGVLILLLPFCVATIWDLARPLKFLSKAAISGIVLTAGLCGLVWSGSKAGWLIMMGLCGLAGWRFRAPVAWKLTALGVVLAAGLFAFSVRYAGFFQKGATSVAARFDYWHAAGRIFLAHPILGTGPGTFQREYGRIKRPETEMARLVHNDYLQQASDSGLVGCIAYLWWIGGIAVSLFRRQLSSDWTTALLACGLLGWIGQGIVEFGLYIPGISWPAFLLAGGVIGIPANRVDMALRNR